MNSCEMYLKSRLIFCSKYVLNFCSSKENIEYIFNGALKNIMIFMS
jgi:hypothetical protein